MQSLKKSALKGSIWSLVGIGGSQVMRLGNNLILTRLLFPEVFGISALITLFMMGLAKFSDVGIGPSIIRHDRRDDQTFFNTAWTVQVVRGVAIWLCACIGAWPFAHFYGVPQLTELIMVSSLTAVISGCNSIGLFTANRDLRIKSLTLIEMGSQLGGVIVTIIWAMLDPTVWALVAGGLVSSFLKLTASHVWLSDFPHKLFFDRKSFQSLIRFGKWIFVSTMLSFFSASSDRLVLGKFLTLHDLGVYSIAKMIASFVEQVYLRLNSQILFPIYSKSNHLSLHALRERVKKIRLIMIGGFLPLLVMVIIFAPVIITFMFDSRYHDAGWMVQIIATGSIVLVCSDIGPYYLAQGNSKLLMKLTAAKLCLSAITMVIGGIFFGTLGVVVGIAATNFFYYPIQIAVNRKYHLWLPFLDLISLAVAFIIIIGGLFVTKQL